MYFYTGDGDDQDPNKNAKRVNNSSNVDDIFLFDSENKNTPNDGNNKNLSNPYKELNSLRDSNNPYVNNSNQIPLSPNGGGVVTRGKSGKGWMVLSIILIVLLLASFGVTIYVAYYLSMNRPMQTTTDVNQLGTVVANNTLRSVVIVEATNESGTEVSRGTGYVVYSDTFGSAYIMTNFHVVEKAMKVTTSNITPMGKVFIRFNSIIEQSYKGEVIKATKLEDKALLKVTGLGAGIVPPVKFGKSPTVNFGDFALAIGNPFGVGLTVSQGCVSNPKTLLDTRVTIGSVEATQTLNVLQTDAAINPGNSGGPLFNKDSMLIGMNTFKTTKGSDGTQAEGMGYALIVDDIRAFINNKGGSNSIYSNNAEDILMIDSDAEYVRKA